MAKKHGFFMGGLMAIVALALVGCGQSWSGKELATETSGVNLSREDEPGRLPTRHYPGVKGLDRPEETHDDHRHHALGRQLQETARPRGSAV